MTAPASQRAAAGLGSSASARVAYFSMEVALDAALPTYSGGLGVLAGDFLRSAADLELPLVAVTLAYRGGYFRQQVDEHGHQVEVPEVWEPTELLTRVDPRIEIEIRGRTVTVGAWQLLITGVSGGQVPVLFLHTDLGENAPEDRDITDQLYGGDAEHRLAQETVLGIGGVSMLRALGYEQLDRFHMNEGHAALLTLRLLESEMPIGDTAPTSEQIEAVRARCVFTTHTPVAAGHDRFSADLVRATLGDERASVLRHLGLLDGEELNMTLLGSALSGYVNAVSLRHAQVTRAMLPKVDVASITNGVHVAHWASPSMAALFDEHLAGWRSDSTALRYALGIPLEAVGAAHRSSKRALLALLAARGYGEADEGGLTIGLARRVTRYKRTLLLLSDPDRLVSIAERHGPLRIVSSGKAHPHDAAGKEAVAALVAAGGRFGKLVRVVFLENYDIELAALLCAGCDLWLNTPERPLEASGTSGMKAAVNGVPSLSILDGWWLEGCFEGLTGWAIGNPENWEEGLHADGGGVPPRLEQGSGDIEAAEAAAIKTAKADADDLYAKLDDVVAPTFFSDEAAYLRVRRAAISLNGSFFSTDRMVREYAARAYRLSPGSVSGPG
ncbi:MAG: alpha-glucan family phosphorylase [Acidimicrobiales bacterium]